MAEKTNVSRTTSVLVLGVLKYLQTALETLIFFAV
jgi:hypothetical protein